ncbi:MAG: hypothetical protein AB7U73_14515 [Pirellulales bacterium]
MFGSTTITDLAREHDRLRPRCHGMIEIADERLVRIVLRRWPKTVSLVDVWFDRAVRHHWRRGNRCWLYFNQPRHCPDYLTLRYVVSTADATLGTFHGALEVLDEIARIKGSQAIVCDASNRRISARLLARWGWEPHCPSRWHRHYIKRFYSGHAAPLADRRLLSARDECVEFDSRLSRGPSTSASELAASSATP